MNPGRLLRDLAAAELVELLGIAEITASLGEAHRKLDSLHSLAARILEEQMTADHTTAELLADVADLTAADIELGTQFGRFANDFAALKAQLANLPTDRPLNAGEQQAINDAVDAIAARTQAIKDRTAQLVTVDPNTPAINGDGGTGQGSVVTIPPVDGPPAPPTVTEPAPPATDPVTETPTDPTAPADPTATPDPAAPVDPAAGDPAVTGDGSTVPLA